MLDRGTGRHRERGAVYTPPILAEYLCRKALQLYLDRQSPPPNTNSEIHILDPAVGTGNFVDAFDRAFSYIVDESPSHRVPGPVAEHRENLGCKIHFYGVDIDAEALKILRERLAQQEHGSRITSLATVELVTGDLLLDREIFPKETRKRGFDLIVGNPPYLSLKSSKAKKQIIRADEIVEKFPGINDVYQAFLRRSWDLLAPEGLISFIIPNTIVKYPECIFPAFEDHLLALENIGERVFPAAPMTPGCIVTYGKTPRPQVGTSEDSGFLFRNYLPVAKKQRLQSLGSLPERFISQFDFTRDLPLVRHLDTNFPTLGELGAIVTRGEEIGKRSLYPLSSGEPTPSRQAKEKEPLNTNDLVPIATAMDMRPFGLEAPRYCYPESRLIKDFYANEKIGLSISFRKRIKCSWLGIQACVKSLICIYQMSKSRLLSALMLYNSIPFDLYHRFKYSYYFEKRENTITWIREFPVLDLPPEHGRILWFPEAIVNQYDLTTHRLCDLVVFAYLFPDRAPEFLPYLLERLENVPELDFADITALAFQLMEDSNTRSIRHSFAEWLKINGM